MAIQSDQDVGLVFQSKASCSMTVFLLSVTLVVTASVHVAQEPQTSFLHGAVAADAEECSRVGTDILQRNGSAVDAAIASMLCIGVVNMQSTGISGGGMMLIYNRESRTSEVVDFREKAPASSTRDMYKGKKREAVRGGKAIAVPGEVAGYYTAWKKYGRLPWKEIVQPAADLAKNFTFGSSPYEAAMKSGRTIDKDPGLKELLLDESGNVHKIGDVVSNPKYAATLEAIGNDPEDFYSGSLAKQILADMKTINGSTTNEDLLNYRPEVRETLAFGINGFKMHLTPPPAGGCVVGMILNILKGFDLRPSDREPDKAGLTYFRTVEAFKFAYAWRSRLGDPAFVMDADRVAKEMLDPATGSRLRHKITDQTHNQSYYGNFSYDVDDKGTSHLSVIAPNGDAVALTSTIHNWFGCGYRSNTTGIIYNDEMENFDNPGDPVIAGFHPNANNFPEPGKRPLSSISPTVVTDDQGRARLILGSSGGMKIIAAVSQVTMNKLWFGRSLAQSVYDPRLYCSLVPSANVTTSGHEEFQMPAYVLEELIKRGDTVSIEPHFSAVQAIYVQDDGSIQATCDPRKGGKPSGF